MDIQLFKHYLLNTIPGGASGKETTCQWWRDVRDADLTPGSGRSPEGGHGSPLQYSCLENPMDRGAMSYSPWGHKESDMTEQLGLWLSSFLHWTASESLLEISCHICVSLSLDSILPGLAQVFKEKIIQKPLYFYFFGATPWGLWES